VQQPATIHHLSRPIWLGLTAIFMASSLTSAATDSPVATGTPSPLPISSASPLPVAPPTAGDPYRGLWIQDTTFLFVRPEFTWGRDPFLKKPGFAVSEEAEPQWALSAVFFDGPESEAIINGARVRLGEEVAGRIVEEIGPNYVLLTKNDSVLELNLPTQDGGAGSIHIEEIEPSTKK
jgi:hypothetical protein